MLTNPLFNLCAFQSTQWAYMCLAMIVMCRDKPISKSFWAFTLLQWACVIGLTAADVIASVAIDGYVH